MEELTVNYWLRRLVRSRRLSSSARLVGHTLALHASWETLDCWPSVEKLAAESGLSRRTVQRATRELQRAGLVWVTFRGKRPASETSLYTLVVPEMLGAGYCVGDEGASL